MAHLKVLLLLSACVMALADSTPPNPARPCWLTAPQADGKAILHMTAVNKCLKDEFFVSFLTFRDGGALTSAHGADASPVTPGAKHQWMGPTMASSDPEGKSTATYVVVVRASDGKVVTPKGVAADGKLTDIASTARRTCQLFERGAKPKRFAVFRARLTPDGSRVLRNDFYSGPPPTPAACEKYVELGADGKTVVTEGAFATAYLPGSCLFAIDDCSS